MWPILFIPGREIPWRKLCDHSTRQSTLSVYIVKHKYCRLSTKLPSVPDTKYTIARNPNEIMKCNKVYEVPLRRIRGKRKTNMMKSGRRVEAWVKNNARKNLTCSAKETLKQGEGNTGEQKTTHQVHFLWPKSKVRYVCTGPYPFCCCKTTYTNCK